MSRFLTVGLLLSLASVLPGHTEQPLSADPEIKDPTRFDPNRPLARDLETHVPDGFTVAVGGDLIIDRSVDAMLGRDAGFAKVAEVIQRADLGVANMEQAIVDIPRFSGFILLDPEEVILAAAPPAAARDLATLGFRLLGRANNHALDWGIAGMQETSRNLDAAGIAYAGVGEDLGLARRAGYLETRRARVGLVSIASTFGALANALDGADGAPARPGISPLHLKPTTILPRAVYDRMRGIRDELYPTAKGQTSLAMFGTTFESGERLAIKYAMDPQDAAAFLRAVRGGKQGCDLLIAAVHSHEPANSAVPTPSTDQYDIPATFLEQLAHAAIDAGTDLWFTTGIHHVGGIEIYHGRPIFYGMGDLFWVAGGAEPPQPTDAKRNVAPKLAAAFRHPERATEHDLAEVSDEGFFANPLPFESFLAQVRFAGNRFAEARLYPVELGYGRRWTEMGVPRPASPTRARAILERVAGQSQRFGTELEIQPDADFGFVGVIH
jgi:poly-gamma-glutamate synthesis protein (capsule biosynthesis protein)